MRRFERSLTQEMVSKTLAALLIVSAITLVISLVRFLGRAALGDIAEAGILPLTLFGFLRILPVILSLSLFLGIFITLVRQIQEHEQVIWSGAGLAPSAWLRPILSVAIPATLIITLLSLFMLPWSAQKRSEFEHLQENQRDQLALTPGLFTETSKDGRIVFVEQIGTHGGAAQRVFIHEEATGQTRLTLAEHGHIEVDATGARFMVLENGRRYDLEVGQPGYRLVEFKRYLVRQTASSLDPPVTTPNRLGLVELWSDPIPAHLQELVWRIGVPISALILALLALPLSQFNPRAGRSLHILFAILLHALYDNGLIIGSALVGSSRLSAPSSLILVHGSAFLLFLLLLNFRAILEIRRTRWAR